MVRRRAPRVHEEPMTYEDYAALPEDGYRYELVDERLELMSPAPSTIHQLFVANLRDALNVTCETEFLVILSPIDVVFSDRDVRQPDLIMVRRDRMGIVKVRGVFGVPDLVVEVMSQGSIQRDRKEKLATYTKYQVPEYWLADPVNVTVEQYLLVGNQLVLSEIYEGDECVCSEQLPFVNFTVSDVVRSIPWLEQ